MGNVWEEYFLLSLGSYFRRAFSIESALYIIDCEWKCEAECYVE